jgi:hypothetical protein
LLCEVQQETLKINATNFLAEDICYTSSNVCTDYMALFVPLVSRLRLHKGPTEGFGLNGSKHYQNSISFEFPHESDLDL